MTDKEKSGFAAVGLGEYVFAKDKAGLEVAKKKTYTLAPNGKFRVKYLFPLWKESPPYKLCYKEKQCIPLKISAE